MRLRERIHHVLQMPFSARQQRAMETRADASLQGFMSSFPEARKEAEELWHELQAIAIVDGFCPAAEDDLLQIYGLADEDLDDVIVGALGRLGYRIPGPEETSGMPPVQTVRCAVRFLAACRAEQSL